MAAAEELAYGQAPVRFIPPSEYKEHAQNWDVTQGYDGLMYFANMHGLLIYDGYSWELTSLPSSVLSLYFSSDEQLYAGLTGDFGILHQETDGSVRYESIIGRLREQGREVPPHNFIDTYQIIELDGIIYMTTDAGLYAWDGQNLEYWEDVTPFLITDHERILLMQHNNGELFIPGQPGSTVEIVDDAGAPVALEERLSGLLPGTDGNYMAVSQSGTLYDLIIPEAGRSSGDEQEHTSGARYRLQIAEGKALDIPEDALVYDIYAAGGYYYITTFNNGIFKVDANARPLDHYNTDTGLNDNFALNLHEDDFGALWMVGMYGISVIKDYTGISVINASNGFEGNIWGAGIYDFNFYVGSSTGLYYARLTGERPLKLTKMLDVNEDGIFSSFQELPVAEDGRTGFFAYSEVGMYRLREDEAEYIDYRVGENMFTSSLFPGLIFTDEFAAHLRALRLEEDGSWEVSRRIPRVFDDAILDIAEDRRGNIWFSTYSGGLYTLIFEQADTRELPAEDYREGPFGHRFRVMNHSGDPRFSQGPEIYFSDIGEELVVAYQNELLTLPDEFTYEAPQFQNIADNGSLSDDAPATLSENASYLDVAEDSRGHIWHISRRDKEVSLQAMPSGTAGRYYSPPFDMNLSFSSRLLHCGICEHIFAVDHEHIYAVNYAKVQHEPPGQPEFGVFLRKAQNSNGLRIPILRGSGADTTPGQRPSLSYNESRGGLHFQAATNYHHTAASNRISFRLRPIDKEFSEPENGMPVVTYRNLWEGRYTLELRAVNKVGETTETEALNFVIRPPWYSSLGAYAGYLLLLTGLIYGIVRWRISRVAQQRDALSLEVKKRTEQLRENSAELARQRDQLAQANVLKVRLLRMTAHDLRSPLTAILGYSGLIEMEESPEEMKTHARTIHDISSRMRAIVQRMLASGARNLEQIDLELEKIALEKPLRATINQLSVFLKERNQEIKLTKAAEDEDITILGDEIRVAEIFENLLSNAIKYSKTNAVINVRLHTENAGKTAVVEIQDQGPGFSDKDLEKMFGEYQQLSGKTANSSDSVGLGLFIVKQLMMVHGGSIEVKNVSPEEGGGACFLLYFPIPENEDTENSS